MATLLALAFSNVPTDILHGLHADLAFAAVNVLACALVFGTGALFVGAGARALVDESTKLDLLAPNRLVVTQWARPERVYVAADVSRLCIVPQAEDPAGWVLEFHDGQAFGAGRRSRNFEAGLAWIRANLAVDEVAVTPEELERFLATPPWLRSARDMLVRRTSDAPRPRR